MKNIDEQFKITQQSLNDLQQKMTDVVRYNKPRSAAYDEMASRFEQSATKLKSIQEEILKRPRFQDVMDNKDLVTRLWAALDATPQFRVRMAEGIDEAENMKLRDQARELHALIFQTIDFMQEKKLISPELLKEFFANSNSEQLLAGHFLLASKPEASSGSGLDDAKLGFSKNLQANIPGKKDKNLLTLIFPKKIYTFLILANSPTHIFWLSQKNQFAPPQRSRKSEYRAFPKIICKIHEKICSVIKLSSIYDSFFSSR